MMENEFMYEEVMKKNVVFVLSALSCCIAVEATDMAEELKLLRQQMKLLEAKIQKLESQQSSAPVSVPKSVEPVASAQS